MVGPFGETLKYFYNDSVELIGEVDGTRILGIESCDFLQIVPRQFHLPLLPLFFFRYETEDNTQTNAVGDEIRRVESINLLTWIDFAEFNLVRSVSVVQPTFSESRRIHPIDPGRVERSRPRVYR
jgi:hypothetical protein